MNQTSKPVTRKLFFALNPSDETHAQLAKINRQLPDAGKAVPEQSLHLTLLFIGAVKEDKTDCLLAGAGDIKLSKFSLRISRPGVFRNGMFWLGCDNVPQGLKRLHQELVKLAGDCGLQTEKRSYVPHITLRRKIRTSQQADTLSAQLVDSSLLPVDWQVEGFSLMESRPAKRSSVYHEMASWPLHD